jgi:hypothetical protein
MRYVVLGSITPFSLKFWFQTDLQNFHPRSAASGGAFDAPDFNYGIYGEDGISGAVDTNITGIGCYPTPRIVLGEGGRSPVMWGPRSLQRVVAWLSANGLQT